MKTKYFIFIILLSVLCACKTQTAVAPLVIRDSISITYKQGQEQPLSISNIKEQPTPIGVRGAAIESRKNSCVPADGSVGVGGATQGASVFEGLLSQRTNKPAVPLIRVDTLYIERWHTEVKVESESESESGKSKPAKPVKPAKLVFYKDCTWGFFILLFLILGRIALRITKAVRLYG